MSDRGHVHDKRCYPFRDLGNGWHSTVDCWAQYQWNKKMTSLLAKKPKPWRGFSFMPKGEVQ